LVAACLPSTVAADPLVSGPQIGQRPGPYSFLIATGPDRGKPTCYVCETADKPGVIIFARSLSAPLAKVVAACDDAVAGRPKDSLRAWLTVLGEKTVGLDELARWSKQAGVKGVPVGVFDDPVGPPSYKLAADADVTILLFVNRKVVANLAFRGGELNDVDLKRFSDELGRLAEKK
jgi:hypothetical protein